MHKRPLKNAASLSLNKDVHSGSRNPILHSSKSPSKPCDHFVVYLYQSVEKLNRTDTSHMLIPFMFPGIKTHFFWRNIYKYKYFSTNNDAEGILSIDLLSDRINCGPITRRRAQQQQHGPKTSSACRNEGWPPPISTTGGSVVQICCAPLPIGSWVIDYQWIPDLTE